MSFHDEHHAASPEIKKTGYGFHIRLFNIIIFAGYENFVSKIHVGNHEDRPDWMGHVDFADLKMKLIGSIIAISGETQE
jgi:uncharacterized protein (TIGR00645 family)